MRPRPVGVVVLAQGEPGDEHQLTARTLAGLSSALFWATIYMTIGFAVLEAWFGEHP